MKNTLWGALAIAGLATSMQTLAAPVQWKFSGTLTTVANLGSGAPPQVAVGNPFEVIVTYDSNPALLSKTLDVGDGAGYFYAFNDTSVTMSFSAGAFGPIPFTNNFHTRIGVRDDYPTGGSPNADTVNFRVIDMNNDMVNGQRIAAEADIHLFSSNLGVYNITNDTMPAYLPSVADSDLLRSFSYCSYVAPSEGYQGAPDSTCAFGKVIGRIDAITAITAVPEPATYALMLAGLATVGMVARRRRS